MDKYRDRRDAGQQLARYLAAYARRKDVLVLALPRGGVPVAYEVAMLLHAPLDVFIVRKIGVPGHDELAMGAMAMGGVTVFNEEIIAELDISQSQIQAVINRETEELKRREMAYRGSHELPVIKNKMIILVDDGIATGATMRAAVKALRQLKPARIIMAVPVADRMICSEMRPLVDEFVCPMQVSHLYAVGAWYDDFTQTEDEEVFMYLQSAREASHD